MTTHLLLNERPLQVLPTLAAIFGINEAIAIQQIHWVITIKHEHQDDKTFYEDFMWCKYTLVQWGEKMPWLSGSSIFRLFKKLENEGIVKTVQPYASSRDQTKWYRIDYDVLHVRSKTAFSQFDDLPSSQNDQIRSSQNDYMINRSKDLKNLNKKQSDSFSENLQEQKKIHPEQKTSNLSDPNNLEDQETPPPTPAPLLPENSSKAKWYDDPMGDRFNSKEPSRKKQTEPLTKDDDFLKYLFTELRKTKSYFRDIQNKDDLTPVRGFIRKCWIVGSEGDVRFAEIQDYLANYEKHKEQSQQHRSQQQPAPIAVQELTATAPPAHIRERFNKAS
jgi:hypothetical protein